MSRDGQQNPEDTLIADGKSQDAMSTEHDAPDNGDALPSFAPSFSYGEQGDESLDPGHEAGENQTNGLDALQDTAFEPSVPPFFEPISEEKLAKAKRTKRILITVIVVLLLLLCAGVAAGVYYYLSLEESHTSSSLVQDAPTLEGSSTVTDDTIVTQTVAMPNLAQMFGRTPEEVIAILGPEYTITKTDSESSSEQPADAEGEEGAADSVTMQVVTVSYTPQQQQGSGTNLHQTQKIYLSLGESGTTIGVYFASSMDVLGYPFSDFASLVATNGSFVESLAAAGTQVAPDIVYTVPDRVEYTEYVDAEASAKKIKKESVTWSGSLLSETMPASFEITYTYDFGAGGVEETSDRYPLQRMLYIKLS